MFAMKFNWMQRAITALTLVAATSVGSTFAQTKGPIRIGVLAPSTGPLAGPGAEMIDGMKMFWKKIITQQVAAKLSWLLLTLPATQTKLSPKHEDSLFKKKLISFLGLCVAMKDRL